MYDTQTRTTMALQRANSRNHRRRDGRIALLSMLCCVMFAADIGVIICINDARHYHSPEHWMYGTTLLPSNTGGYILVAIVTFVIAVAVTVFCMRKHEQMKQEEEEG